MARIQLKKKAAKKTAKKKTVTKQATKKTAGKGNKAAKGKRYTDEEKDVVRAFVEKVNLEKGRGGVAAAVREFGITALTVSSWVKQGGGVSVRGARGAGVEGVLAQLLEVQKLIAKKRAELDKLESQFGALKKSL